MTQRIKGTDGIVRHRSIKGVWSRVDDKEQYDNNYDEIDWGAGEGEEAKANDRTTGPRDDTIR